MQGYELGRRGRRAVYFNMLVYHGTAHWPIRRRFRQVTALHAQLLRGLGRSAMVRGLPLLPPKVTCRALIYGQRDERFLTSRVTRLQRYFDGLLRYVPYVEQCEALFEFLCSVDVNNMSYDALLDLGQALGRGGPSPQPLDPAAIAALPRRAAMTESAAGATVAALAAAAAAADTADASAKSEAASASAADKERCVICQEPLKDSEDVRVLPCGHEYHFPCIERWVRESNTCCVCHSVAVLPVATTRDLDK